MLTHVSRPVPPGIRSPNRMRCYIHHDVKPRSVLGFRDKSLHFVTEKGTHIRCVRNADGTLRRETREEKMARKRAAKSAICNPQSAL